MGAFLNGWGLDVVSKSFEARSINRFDATAIELDCAGVAQPQERARRHVANRPGRGGDLCLRKVIHSGMTAGHAD